MLFNSFQFIIFFPLVCIGYYSIPFKWRNMFLLICSYVLYMNWIPVYALILLGITLTTYTAARLFELYGSSTSKRKIIMWSGVIFTLTCLLFFKYYNFINESLHELLANIGLRFKLPGLNWAIPIGISFYTFQAYGYMMDVYWSKIKAEKNFFDYALFVAFFPQIASGPISKASSLLPQIKRQRPFNSQQVVGGGEMAHVGNVYESRTCRSDSIVCKHNPRQLYTSIGIKLFYRQLMLHDTDIRRFCRLFYYGRRCK